MASMKKIASTISLGIALCAAFLLALAGACLAAPAPITVPNIATLVAGNYSSYATVQVLGYYTAGDGGGGFFNYSAASAATTNPCTVFAPSSGVGRFIRSLPGGEMYPEYCGADRTGVANSSAAIQAAFTVAGAASTVKCTSGATYKIVTGVTISQPRVQFISDGKYNCNLNFAPTGAGTALTLSAGASILYQGSVRGINFCSSDTTYVKTAIKASDVSLYELSRIVIGCSGTPWHDTTNASVGLQTLGRELSLFDTFDVSADIPIRISKNPNTNTSVLEDADHFHFTNLDLGPAASKSSIVVDTGVYFSQTIFDGYQAWVGGTNGFYWADTTGTSQSQGLSFENVRAERVTGTAFYLHSNASLLSVNFKNIFTDAPFGVDMVKVYHPVLETFNYASTTGVGITATAAAGIENITLTNDFWRTGSTFSLTGYKQNLATGATPAINVLPSNAVYLADDGNLSPTVYIDGVGHQSVQFTLADTATQSLPAHDNGIISVEYAVAGVGATKTLGGTAIFNTAAVVINKISGTADFDGSACGAGNFCVSLQSASVAQLRNRTGETITGTVNMTFSK